MPVQKVDSAIHWINHYPLDSTVGFPNTYPMDSDLSDGYYYPSLEQPGPGRQRSRYLKLAYISTVERRLKPRARVPNGAFSLTWPASMQIYWNKKAFA